MSTHVRSSIHKLNLGCTLYVLLNIGAKSRPAKSRPTCTLVSGNVSICFFGRQKEKKISDVPKYLEKTPKEEGQ